MAADRHDDESTTRRYIIRPNYSLDWRGTLHVVGALSILPVAYAVAFFWIGLPWILPFSGLEVLALCCAFAYCLGNGSSSEIVTVSQVQVSVERRLWRRREVVELPRHRARVTLVPPTHAWYPSRLTLGVHDQELEIGKCLRDDERRALARELRSALVDVTA